MVTTVLLWVLVVVLIVLGLAGTVLPALPGTALVLAGVLLGAWIDDFTRVGWAVVAACAVMFVLSWVLDFAAGLLGARRVNASREALIGAALGTVAGLFMGIVGVLFMPLVGAAVGEYIARSHAPNAVRVGVATWMGTMLGLIAKVVLAFMMIGLFVVALIV
jgi:uncharacterized protein